MKPYFNLLIWVVFGLMIGLLIHLVTQPSTDVKPQQNITLNTTTNDTISLVQNTTTKKNITFVLIQSPCEECNYDEIPIQQTVTFLSELENVTLESSYNLTYPSPEAIALVTKYNITELPTLVVMGDTEADQELVSIWLENVGTKESDNTLVSRDVYPPYYDIGLGKSAGLVSGIAIGASNCSDCMDAYEFMPALEDITIAVVFTNKTVLDENDTFAQELISSYNITKLPVLLLDEEFFAYPVSDYFTELGTVENGWFILRDVKPPYKELPDGKIRGLVDAIYITNSSCSDCFDPEELGLYFSDAAGLYLNNQTTYEANSTDAISLIEKYDLTSLPAVLLSSEASVYNNFDVVWQSQNNSIESDGWHIFRNYDLLDATNFYRID